MEREVGCDGCGERRSSLLSGVWLRAWSKGESVRPANQLRQKKKSKKIKWGMEALRLLEGPIEEGKQGLRGWRCGLASRLEKRKKKSKPGGLGAVWLCVGELWLGEGRREK